MKKWLLLFGIMLAQKAAATIVTFDNLLNVGELNRSTINVEQGGYQFHGSNLMNIVAGGTRSYLTSDALALTNGDDPNISAINGNNFSLRGFSAMASTAGSPIELTVSGAISSNLTIRQRFVIPNNNTGLSNFQLNSIFSNIGFSSMSLGVNATDIGSALYIDDAVLETQSPLVNLTSTPSFVGPQISFDNILQTGETRKYVSSVEQAGLRLLLQDNTWIYDQSLRNFLTSDALVLTDGNTIQLGTMSGKQLELKGFRIRTDEGADPAATFELFLTAELGDNTEIVQRLSFDDTGYFEFSLPDFFDGLYVNNIRISPLYSNNTFINGRPTFFIDDITASIKNDHGIPEPGTLILLMVGSFCLLVGRIPRIVLARRSF